MTKTAKSTSDAEAKTAAAALRRGAKGDEAGGEAGTLDEARAAVLAAALELAPFEGFSSALLDRAGREAGVARTRLAAAFPHGLSDLIRLMASTDDAAMEAALAEQDLSALKIRERITLAVRTRLEVMEGHKAAAREAFSLLSRPQWAPLGTRLTARTVHKMWRLAGDTSADFNFYTKRAILAGVYGSTGVVWLQDESEGAADTWAFLDRRIEGVMGFEKVKGRVMKAAQSLPSALPILAGLRYPSFGGFGRRRP